MKNIYLLLVALLVVFASCSEEKTTETDTAAIPEKKTEVKKPTFPVAKISGKLAGGTGEMKVFFDKISYNSNSVLTSKALNTDGDFKLESEIEEPGIYRLRLGARSAFLVLKGGEDLTFNANLSDFENYTVTGSKASEELATALRAKYSKPKDIQGAIESSNSSLVSWFLVRTLPIGQYIDNYKTVRSQMMAEFPNTNYTKEFSNLVSQVDAQLAAQPVRMGKEAPEITLPSPDGKNYSLSQLKGKVVLIDFWASWCRPCRMANPHLVQTYNQYNKKGFTVFSVSLDRTKSKWEKAITQDNLGWKYHVSELKQWQGAINKLYGVSSIPKTFLVDRDGKIAGINLRGAALEEKIKELL